MSRATVAGCAAAALCVACASEPPAALRVGPIAYSAADLGALGDDARESLATLTAFALAASDGRLAELAAQWAQPELDSASAERLVGEMALRLGGRTDAQLRAAYLADPEVELTVRHLVVLVNETALEPAHTRARARVVGARNRILAGESFAQVAAEVSEEPGAAQRGGLLEPGRRGSWVDPFWEAANALAVGEVSDITQTEYGYHVLMLEDRRVLPLEEVRRDVARRLASQDGYLAAGRAWADSVRSTGADEALLAEAARLGLGPTERERARAASAWTARAEGWAAALGFAPGADAEAIRDAAMRALASDRQGVVLARREVEARADALRALYPVASASSSDAVQAEARP